MPQTSAIQYPSSHGELYLPMENEWANQQRHRRHRELSQEGLEENGMAMLVGRIQ